MRDRLSCFTPDEDPVDLKNEFLRAEAHRESPAGPSAVQQSFAPSCLPARKPERLPDGTPESLGEAKFTIRSAERMVSPETPAAKPRTYSGNSIRVPDPEPTFVRPMEDRRPFCVFHGHGTHDTEDCFFNR